jgi:hypothetical protein
MGNIFAITTAADDINADAAGKATAIFTVTNTSTKPMRALAKARPIDNTEQDWLNIEGESERDFGAGATQQFTVNFNRPAGEAGKFPFRLDVASVLDPDEQFTEGPKVTVKVNAPAAKSKKGFPLWIIILIAVVLLLLVGGILFFVLRGSGPKETGNNNPPPVTPTPAPAARFEGTWMAKNPETVYLQKCEIQQNGNFLSVKVWMRESDHSATSKLLGTFTGGMLANGTAEAGGTYGQGSNMGYAKIELRSLAPDQILLRVTDYSNKSAPEGAPSFVLTQVLYK